MNVKQYPEEKRKIIVEYSSEDFAAFLDEIQGRERDELQEIRAKIRRIPKERLSVTVQAQEFMFRLRKEIAHPESDIWKWFGEIWTLWIGSHDEFIVLADVANESDFDEGGHIVQPNSDLDVKYLRILTEASQDYQIDQETIQRFYEYGYFLPDERIGSLINEARPYAEIEKWRRETQSQIDKVKEVEPLANPPSKPTATGEETGFDQQLKDVVASFENRFSDVERKFSSHINELKQAITTLKSQLANRRDDESAQMTEAPRIAHQAVQIGECYAAELGEEKERYQDENGYLSDFGYCLRRFGVTDSDETAAAIHVALKAFPALEIADSRVIEVWRLICDNHLHITTIYVEMGWLGEQDWFPYFFSDKCFKERLERKDLNISIRKMLEIGDMPWAIHLRNCDLSFPESYLPPFLDGIGDFCEGGIKVFLTRCSGTNRCETNEDVYTWVARLPEPQGREPIEARNLRPSDIVVTRTDWESWCCPNADADQPHERQLTFLSQLRAEIENIGVPIPTTLLREIRRYQQLSHDIMAPTVALDWALTLRLLPWIGNRSKLIDMTLTLIGKDGLELPHFQNALQNIRERDS